MCRDAVDGEVADWVYQGQGLVPIMAIVIIDVSKIPIYKGSL